MANGGDIEYLVLDEDEQETVVLYIPRSGGRGGNRKREDEERLREAGRQVSKSRDQ